MADVDLRTRRRRVQKCREKVAEAEEKIKRLKTKRGAELFTDITDRELILAEEELLLARANFERAEKDMVEGRKRKREEEEDASDEEEDTGVKREREEDIQDEGRGGQRGGFGAKETPRQTNGKLNTSSNNTSPVRRLPGKQRRTRIPDKPDKSFSLWSIMKNCIGKDLSKMSIPVNFSEPISFLQRLNEDFEYSEVLDRASEAADNFEQLALVAAFTVSSYRYLSNAFQY